MLTDAEINDGFSIEGWVRPTSDSVTDGNFHAALGFDQKFPSSPANQVTLGMESGAWAVRYTQTDGDVLLTDLSPSDVVCGDVWNHVVLTFDGDTDTFTVFYNGQQGLSTTDPDFAADGVDGFYLGTRKRGTNPPGGPTTDVLDMWEGDFVQIRVYDDVLTRSEVKQNFLTHAALFIPEPSSLVMWLGLVGIGLLGRMRRRCRS